VIRVVALVADVMDRSRIGASIPTIEIVARPSDVAGADVVIVDLTRHLGALDEIRRCAPDALVVAYGPHVDTDMLAAAEAAGADRVLPRSRFFRDPAGALEDAEPPDR